jgi:hypothetical protein
LKKTGMATAATAIALHGFKVEVLASESAPTKWYSSWRKHAIRSGGPAGTYQEALAMANNAVFVVPYVLLEEHAVPASTPSGTTTVDGPVITVDPPTDPGGGGPFTVTVSYYHAYFEVS